MQQSLRTSPKINATTGNIEVDRIRWAVNAVSIYLPGSTCLTRALTGYKLLANNDSQVKIGVGKGSKGEFEAHAWLEYDDQVIIGESEKEYVHLFDLSKRGRV